MMQKKRAPVSVVFMACQTVDIVRSLGGNSSILWTYPVCHAYCRYSMAMRAFGDVFHCQQRNCAPVYVTKIISKIAIKSER